MSPLRLYLGGEGRGGDGRKGRGGLGQNMTKSLPGCNQMSDVHSIPFVQAPHTHILINHMKCYPPIQPNTNCIQRRRFDLDYLDYLD